MLRVLGKPSKVLDDKVAVVKLETKSLPPLRSPVYSSSLKKVGLIVDVIGSTREPYVVVKLINPEYFIKDFHSNPTLYFKSKIRKERARERRRHGRSYRKMS